MHKQSVIWLTLTLSVLLILAVACGPAAPTPNPTISTGVIKHTPTVPARENLYVLDGYTPPGANSIGGQQIVAFHPGSANPATLVTLPTGLTSQNHQRLYTATAKDGHTTITIVNTRTGATMHSFIIAGTYSLAEQDFANSVSSPDGRWLALRQSGWANNRTTIALVDTRAGKLVKTIQGHYLTQQAFTGVGLSADGHTLYAVDPVHGITLLDAATGEAQQTISGPAHTPWGIEWVTD